MQMNKFARECRMAVLGTACLVAVALAGCQSQSAPPAAPFASWTDSAAAPAALVGYMGMVTDPANPDFIPEADRIAVFDMDGTLRCETPTYIDLMIFASWVLDHPAYKDRATPHEREVALAIRHAVETGTPPKTQPDDPAFTSVFEGMGIEQLQALTRDYLGKPVPGYRGLDYRNAIYRPMLELIDYLKANKFTIYVITGTNRFQARTIIDDSLGVPPWQIIGTDPELRASGQAEGDRHYSFKRTDTLELGDDTRVKMLRFNKVEHIVTEIGKRPVLAFGNSSGDDAMLDYVASGERYPALSFTLLADDTEREYGNADYAGKVRKKGEGHGWFTISMRDDWKTIYGDGVTLDRP
ncbi:MAG: haloacid dehalogenase-like hydrolase [Succinivibrionaceae bacterium]|nr:haloacid dehalogenase-like hydrolase [Succinivibrionaceae bacterium]